MRANKVTTAELILSFLTFKSFLLFSVEYIYSYVPMFWFECNPQANICIHVDDRC